MAENLAGIIANAYRRTHLHALEVVVDLSEKQLTQRAGSSTTSILFHLWHIARWADFLREVLTQPGNQLWLTEKLAAVWGLSENTLGYAETGFGMDDNLAASLPLTKDSVLDYAQKSFATAEQAVASLDDEKMLSMYHGPRAMEYYQGEKTFAYIVLRSIRHESRHVGNMESLRGILGFGQPPQP